MFHLQEAERRAHQAVIAEEKRRAAHEAAERHREEVRLKLEAKLARLASGGGKASDAVAEALAALKSAGGPAGESPGKPVPIGGVARGGPGFQAYSFSGAST